MIDKVMDLFNSITCLCAEGPEFMDKIQLTDRIQKDAIAGYELCKQAEKPFRLVYLDDDLEISVVDYFKTKVDALDYKRRCDDGYYVQTLCVNGEWVKVA